MHPAKSVIFFTTASGAGYGLMIWLAVSAALGVLPNGTPFGLVAFGIGLGLIAAGLLSSTLHLGRPERAWRAMSQWRSSWLSREGLAAIVAFVPLGLFALTWITGLASREVAAALGLAGAALALVVLYCTAMIYASLKTIPAWHNGWTVLGYLVLGPMTGALVLALLLAVARSSAATAAAWCALALLVAGALTKAFYWRHLGSAAPTSTAGTATGLGHLGRVEMTGSPHDSDNYLLREMGFHIARKHAAKLRGIALVSGFAIPAVALALGLAGGGGAGQAIAFAVAVLSSLVGVAAERWLFFAEAKHVVTLYYGAEAV